MKSALNKPAGVFLAVCFILVGASMLWCTKVAGPSKFEFRIGFKKEICPTPLDGRLLVVISTDGSSEPRFQISDGAKTQIIFGIDAEDFSPGDAGIIDEGVLGYPLRSLAALPRGEYYVQALLHRYETFHRADGHVVKLPMDRGEGQRWNRAPGNLYSTPRKALLDPGETGAVEITLDREIPPIPPPKERRPCAPQRLFAAQVQPDVCPENPGPDSQDRPCRR